RVWKTVQTKRHSAMRPKSLRKGWEVQQERRREREIVHRVEKEMKDAVKAEKQAQRERAEERKKRKEENDRRAELVQHVSAAKVKRMTKRQLRGVRMVTGSAAAGK
ncbi:hypothetical protein HK405_009488, partial [Cladochytrium tenue]